ncbi:uncharacterized protein LOC130748388 [Lotus japonicus]|uniref:uncharacterized protein LOC130748388 n=1 Tax=Lotus japonicus TaxID=34305 RepID=UPI0025841AEE|nr:uncharacterized protein LOC130748388 [Lotus japonicus]
MDPLEFPFDIKAYKRQSEIEERYIVNRFREQRNQIEEGYTPRVKRKYLYIDHAAANQRLIDDYFTDQPTYDDGMFCRRFPMRKHVFFRIVGDLSSSDNYFTQAKCTTAMRMLAYGVAADAVDEYIKIGGTLNDINVLDSSPVFDDVEQENTPRVNFFVNQRSYNMSYYLVDDIYPSYLTFVKSIRLPQSEPDKLFAK